VGLIQNAIEAAGICTISLTAHPYITKMVGAPRAIYMRYPQGNLFGAPDDPHGQRTILQAALQAVASMSAAGTILEYPARWRGGLRNGQA
jgi:hypothetical protein